MLRAGSKVLGGSLTPHCLEGEQLCLDLTLTDYDFLIVNKCPRMLGSHTKPRTKAYVLRVCTWWDSDLGSLDNKKDQGNRVVASACRKEASQAVCEHHSGLIRSSADANSIGRLESQARKGTGDGGGGEERVSRPLFWALTASCCCSHCLLPLLGRKVGEGKEFVYQPPSREVYTHTKVHILHWLSC